MNAPTPPGFTDSEAYLIVEAKRGGVVRENGLRSVWSSRITGMRTNRPQALSRDQVAVKVKVRLPEAAFDPLQPTALIVVPEDLIQRGPIQVEAQDAGETHG